MIDIFRENCFGCTACASVCPKHAISFERDKLGFLYPIIDNKCVGCNLCEKICPVQTCTTKLNPAPKFVYAARHVALDEVKSSRSGAAFIAFSDVILKKGGSVYGAAFEDGLTVEHIKATCTSDRNRLKGSKYVQSDMRGVINLILEDLKADKLVLFSGTPCQVAGVISVVPETLQTNLFTVDIICHGAPSPQLYKDYLFYLEQRNGSKVSSFDFRDKSINGWHDHKESATFENGKKIIDTIFTNIFYTNVFFRDSCYICPFAKTNRVSDITLGDLWGWDSIDKSLNNDDQGISLLLINSLKGKELLEESKSSLSLLEIEMEKCMQRNLKEPTQRPNISQELQSVYFKKGIEGLIKYLYHPSLKQRLIRKIKRLLMYG